MKGKLFVKFVYGLALVLAPAVQAQYTIDWHTMDGGGGTSAGGGYSLDGSIGQPDASLTMSGGSFSLLGGFWSVVAVPTAGTPLLRIFVTATNTAIISWPSSSTGFALQQKAGLDAQSWVAPPEAISNNGTNNFIIVNPSVGNRFYRLFKP
jgi:hypothetical protein